jgi:hypothetical protein
MYEMEGASPGLAAPASQLPGYSAPRAAPPGPDTRVRYRFPDSPPVPRVSPGWCPFPAVSYF